MQTVETGQETPAQKIEENPDAPPVKRGRGRPKGSKTVLPSARPARMKSFRELYDSAVEKNAPRLINAAIRSAMRGDSRALIDVLNRVLGPPTQRVEMSGPGGAPLALQAAAPVALALMSTEELRAILGLQARLGLPDVQVQPVRDLLALRPLDGASDLATDEPPQAAEPGLDGSSPLLLPPPLSLLPDHGPRADTDPPQPPNPGEDIDPPTAGQDTRTPTADERRGKDGPSPAAHLSPGAAGGGQEAVEVRAEPAEPPDVTLPSDPLTDSTLTPSQSGGYGDSGAR